MPLLLAALGAYVALIYGQGLQLAFLNDDYLFLDKVRGMSFPDLWKPEQLAFGWYRPWSREVHYWTLRGWAGLHEGPFHFVSLLLWLGIMFLFFKFVRRVSGGGAASIATAGLAGLALWSAPLLWIAGAQDLWMLLFGLLFLHAVLRGWIWAAAPCLALALLSKETAAALPGIAFGYLWIVEGERPAVAFRRTAVYWLILLSWLLLHPTLADRLFGPLRHSAETRERPGPGLTLLKTLLAQLNLEGRLAPEHGWGPVLARGALGAAILGAIPFVLGRPDESDASHRSPPAGDRAVFAFGALWTGLGWGILFLPSIGWHAYYGVLGSLGCWLIVGTALRRHLRVAIALVMMIALLREARAATPSWDWGTFWYQKRAGSFLGAIRHRLFQLHPDLPPHSRIFLSRLPNNIGLLAGDGPAIRVWYDDPTLKAGFYSAYAMRNPDESAGTDYFLRYDSLQVLVEVEPRTAAGPGESVTYPGWQRDQTVLASLFLQAGNPGRAADAYARLWRGTEGRPDYALFAATAYEAAGDTNQAEDFYRIAREAVNASELARLRAALLGEARGYLRAAEQSRSASMDGNRSRTPLGSTP